MLTGVHRVLSSQFPAVKNYPVTLTAWNGNQLEKLTNLFLLENKPYHETKEQKVFRTRASSDWMFFNREKPNSNRPLGSCCRTPPQKKVTVLDDLHLNLRGQKEKVGS